MVLLDSHTWLWALTSPGLLGPTTRARLLDSGAELSLSMATPWELGIKAAQGKLPATRAWSEFVSIGLADLRTRLLPITLEHALTAAALPRHHGDPFDRMIIAQAQVEQIPVLTADPHFASYDIEVLDART